MRRAFCHCHENVAQAPSPAWLRWLSRTHAGLFALMLLSLTGCSLVGQATPEESQPPAQSVDQQPPTPLQQAQAQRARQFVLAGIRELELGAFYAATTAFQSAVELEPSNQIAKDNLERARQQLGNLRAGAPPAPPRTDPPGVAIPPPQGCLGDERLTVSPPLAAPGQKVSISLTSARPHRNVHIAGPWPIEFVGGERRGDSYLWQFNGITGDARGEFPLNLFVDYNTQCGSTKIAVTAPWEPIAQGLPSGGDFKVTALAASPAFASDKTLFVALDGAGILKTANGDAAAPSFSQANGGLGNKAVLSLGLSPEYGSDRTLFAGTRDGGLFRSTDGGSAWSQLQLPGRPPGDVTAIAVSPGFGSDNVLLVAVDGTGVLGSSNRGADWILIADGLGDRGVQSLALSPSFVNDRGVVAGTRAGGAYQLAPIAAGNEPGQLFYSRWASLPGGAPDVLVRTIALSPNYRNDRIAFAAGGAGGLFRFEANAWRPAGGLQSERLARGYAIAFSPRFAQDGVAYLGAAAGVFRTSDRGENWVPMAAGMPAELPGGAAGGVHALALSPDFGNDHLIFAGVWGDRLYRARD